MWVYFLLETNGGFLYIGDYLLGHEPATDINGECKVSQ